MTRLKVQAWLFTQRHGSHNSATPGYGIAWSLHRVTFLAEFTGQPLIATRVALTAKEGQKPLTLVEATQIADSLGLATGRSTPNMEEEGTILWPGDHLSLRYIGSHPGLDETMVEIWSDQDPTGGLPPEE